jgi:hypothetical protein
MSFRAQVLRVLIASPSDLEKEREVATAAIHDWNVQHAMAEGVVLLPVRWETHATPRANIRPQQAINEELVGSSDILIGMFWTKLGSNTGVAESGTVEEINQFVADDRPAMLYFSKRKLDSRTLDRAQQRKLRVFRTTTLKRALVGNFRSAVELRRILLRDLVSQVRKTKAPPSRSSRIERAREITELIVMHRKYRITPSLYDKYADELLHHRNRPAALTVDPVPEGEVGPNGHPVGYTKEGDKVEWLPDEERPGKAWPMILRRNDKAILAAEEEFFDVIWYDRKLVLQQKVAEGEETIDPAIEAGMLKAVKVLEKKYGRKKLRSYYHDDFGWGMLNGKLSALRWVMGDEWDFLDT